MARGIFAGDSTPALDVPDDAAFMTFLSTAQHIARGSRERLIRFCHEFESLIPIKAYRFDPIRSRAGMRQRWRKVDGALFAAAIGGRDELEFQRPRRISARRFSLGARFFQPRPASTLACPEGVGG